MSRGTRRFRLANAAFSFLRQSYELNAYTANKTIGSVVVPGVSKMLEIQSDALQQVFGHMIGTVADDAPTLFEKAHSGARYGMLVKTLGRQLFGSARYIGERVLWENDYLRLSYLPADEGVKGQGWALFHSGGFLPYSDKIFRILPESNLFANFTSRGIPVYAMELKKDSCELNLRQINMERVIEDIDWLADMAWQHQKDLHAPKAPPKMVIEGYCGLSTPMLGYLAAKPQRADKKFKVAMTMVAPVNAPACSLLAKFVAMQPDAVAQAHISLSRLLFGHIHGENIRAGMDIPLGSTLSKTRLGYFSAGWHNPEHAHISGVDDLDPRHRREITGAYWISPTNARRSPMPVDLVTVYSKLFKEGVDESLTLPVRNRGERVTLHRMVDKSKIRLVGLYGGKDPVVPPTTGDVLVKAMGDRYTHVVHPKAGHISYVLSPHSWLPGHPSSFDPNPIDLLTELHARD